MSEELSSARRRVLAKFVRQLLVPPGEAIRLNRDCDPGATAGVKNKAQGQDLLEEGVQLLSRLPGAARGRGHVGRAGGAAGAGHGRQGRRDPPRDERRQSPGRVRPQLQGPVLRGARPRLPVALRQPPAGEGPDRHLQPLPLRGGACRARAPRVPRAPETAGRRQGQRDLEAPLSRDQRLGALPLRQRPEDREAVPERLQGGAAQAPAAAHRPPRPQLEVLRTRTSSSEGSGTTTSALSPRRSRTRARSGRPGT